MKIIKNKKNNIQRKYRTEKEKLTQNLKAVSAEKVQLVKELQKYKQDFERTSKKLNNQTLKITLKEKELDKRSDLIERKFDK